MEKISFHDQIAKNNRNSILLIVILVFTVSALIYVVAILLLPEIAIFFLASALAIMIAHAYTSYRYGDKIVLAATNAMPADPVEHIYLINVVEGLSLAAGIPPPEVYVVEDEEINAFATGKDPEHASIAVTTGALKNLNRVELEGVVGHEISHVKNNDIKFMTLVAVLVGLVAILSYMLLRSYRLGRSGKGEERGLGPLILIGLLLAIFAPVASRLVQAMISRRREFLADASSAQLTRYPEGLASALEKIMRINQGRMQVSESISHLFISDPNRSPLDSLFATHPPIEERIRILRAM